MSSRRRATRGQGARGADAAKASKPCVAGGRQARVAAQKARKAELRPADARRWRTATATTAKYATAAATAGHPGIQGRHPLRGRLARRRLSGFGVFFLSDGRQYQGEFVANEAEAMACSISPAPSLPGRVPQGRGRRRGHLHPARRPDVPGHVQGGCGEGHGVYTMARVIVTKARRGATSATARHLHLRNGDRYEGLFRKTRRRCGREVPRRRGIKQGIWRENELVEELAPDSEPRYFARRARSPPLSRACRPRPSPAPSCRDRLSAKHRAARQQELDRFRHCRSRRPT